MPKRTREYHQFLLEQLTDPAFASEYLNEARQDSKKIFLKALRNVAEARRMAVVAAEAGVNRESLYKTLSEDGNPRLETYDSILNALGIDYEFKPKGMHDVPPCTPAQICAQTSSFSDQVDFSQRWTTTQCLVVSTSATSLSARNFIAPPEIPVYLLGSEETTDTIAKI